MRVPNPRSLLLTLRDHAKKLRVVHLSKPRDENVAADVVGSSGARYAASAWHGATPWIASAFFGAAAALAFLHPSRTNGFSIASLVAASNGESRRVEPRLSGKSPWAPFRKSDSGGTDLSKALRTTLAQGDLIPSARHTVGLAQLLAGRDRAALSALSAATESSSGDPRTWSDLAAASYVVAGRYNTPELLADALGAADSALAIDANLPEALFNRALILERLQLRDDAREAWNRYLSNESDGAWIAEAREHLRRVAPLPSFCCGVIPELNLRYFAPLPLRKPRSPGSKFATYRLRYSALLLVVLSAAQKYLGHRLILRPGEVGLTYSGNFRQSEEEAELRETHRRYFEDRHAR